MVIGGSPAGVHAAATALGGAGTAFDEAGTTVGSHGEAVTGQWYGSASDAAGEAIHALKTSTLSVADAVSGCERVYATYADELAAAQAAWLAGQEQQTTGQAGQRAAADAALAADSRGADDPGRGLALDAARSASEQAGAVAAQGRTAMADAVAREARANEAAATAVDAIVELLQDVVAAHPTAAGPVLGPPVPTVVLGPPVPEVFGPPSPPEPTRQPASHGAPADDGFSWVDGGHLALDALGFVPGFGAVADGANAVWYAAEGNYVDAAFSAAAAVPGAGDAVAAARLGAKGIRAARGAEEVSGAAVIAARAEGPGVRAIEAAPSGAGPGAPVAPPPVVAPPMSTTSSGRRFVTTGRGVTFDIPDSFTQHMANNDKGLLFKSPTTARNENTIRIMEPNSLQPDGYVVMTNRYGQPLDANGRTGTKATMHIPQTYPGPWPSWPTS